MRHQSLQHVVLLASLAVICLTVVSSEAVELNGRVTSSLYGLERFDKTYWNSYIGFNSLTTLLRDSQTRSLKHHTNLRWKGDLADKEPGSPQTYIYSFHFSLQDFPTGSEIYVGRQFTYNTLGSNLIDGLRIKYQVLKSAKIDLFGGARVFHEIPDKIQSLSDNGLFGGRIEYTRSRPLRLGLSWLARTSEGSVSRHRAGIDFRREIRRAEFYGRMSYDLLNLDMAEFLARISARPDTWYLSAEFHWRKPSVEGNTVFGLIDADAYKAIRMDVTRTLWHDIRVLVQFHQELLDGANAWRSVFGLGTTRFRIAWHHRDGYGGEKDGFQGQAQYNFRSNLEIYGTAFISQYLIQPETPKRIDAYSSSTGILWRPGWAMQVRVEGQYLRNAVNKSDFRLFVNLAKSFKLSAGESETSK